MPYHLKKRSPSIYRLLNRLRRRIRRHVLLSGLANAVVWITVAFWVVLAVDYLPIKIGFQELAVPTRAVVLGMVATGLTWIIYSQILSRFFVRMSHESMALLIERKHPEFIESLVTTVSQQNNLATSIEREELSDPAMLELTRATAESLIPEVKLERIFNTQSLQQKLILAAIAGLSLLGFFFVQPEFAARAANRLVLLDPEPWPRHCELKIAGIKIARENPVEGIAELGQTLRPAGNSFRIARGTSLTVLVQATAIENATGKGAATGAAILEAQRKPNLPESCRFVYQTAHGRGSLMMNRIGSPRDGTQVYSIDGAPLNGLLEDLSFRVYGGDAFAGPFELSIVDQPAVVKTRLACVFPSYMVDEKSGRWTPRDRTWTGHCELPMGTIITTHSTTNKTIHTVYMLDVATEKMESFAVGGEEFSLPLPALTDPIHKEIYLCDEDGLVSETPFVISIAPIEDSAPQVLTTLTGIGTAITPNAKIPFAGAIEDDYGVADAWLEIETPDLGPVADPVSFDSSGAVHAELDLLRKRRDVGESFELPTTEGSTVSLIVKASDRFDLDGGRQIGFGDKWVLDVVDDSRLLRLLERQEVAQRRRLEQIYLEISDAHVYLHRTKPEDISADMIVEPGDLDPNDGDSVTADNDEPRALEFRLLFAQRTIMQIDKSIQEIIGVANSFENLRLQLVNNRIDAEDRKTRLKTQIEAPLREISGPLMSALKESAIKLESQLRDLQSGGENHSLTASAIKQSNVAIEQINGVLLRLNLVLDSLVKYETQNELLEIVRKMIKEQQSILDRTKKERQEKAFEGLLD